MQVGTVRHASVLGSRGNPPASTEQLTTRQRTPSCLSDQQHKQTQAVTCTNKWMSSRSTVAIDQQTKRHGHWKRRWKRKPGEHGTSRPINSTPAPERTNLRLPPVGRLRLPSQNEAIEATRQDFPEKLPNAAAPGPAQFAQGPRLPAYYRDIPGSCGSALVEETITMLVPSRA